MTFEPHRVLDNVKQLPGGVCAGQMDGYGRARLIGGEPIAGNV